jgi:hypothetical protein
VNLWRPAGAFRKMRFLFLRPLPRREKPVGSRSRPLRLRVASKGFLLNLVNHHTFETTHSGLTVFFFFFAFCGVRIEGRTCTQPASISCCARTRFVLYRGPQLTDGTLQYLWTYDLRYCRVRHHLMHDAASSSCARAQSATTVLYYMPP